MAADAAAREGGLPALQDLIQPISAFDQEQIFGLCDVILTFLINPTSSDFQSELQKFSDENEYVPLLFVLRLYDPLTDPTPPPTLRSRDAGSAPPC
jgi:hypothetical protein